MAAQLAERGQPSATTARPARSRACPVARCSPCGLACGTTTAGFLAAATSAMAFMPPWVTTTSAWQTSGQGSATHDPVRPPSTVHSQSGVAAAASRSWRAVTSDPPLPCSTSAERPRRPAPGSGVRPSNRENAPTARIRPATGSSPSRSADKEAGHGPISVSASVRPRRGAGSPRWPGSTTETTGTPISLASAATSTETSATTTEGAARWIHPAIPAIRSRRPGCPSGAPRSCPCAVGSIAGSPVSSRGSLSQSPGQSCGRASEDSPVTRSVSRAAMHRALAIWPWPT
jgi:hypothetical protein